MPENRYQKSPKFRGIIVVDACELFNMSESSHMPECDHMPECELDFVLNSPPKKHSIKPEESKTFLEILTTLSKNGYKIIIPEMVSYEVSGVIANGIQTNPEEKTRKNVFSDLEAIKTLCLRANPYSAETTSGIEMAPAIGESNYATFIKELHNPKCNPLISERVHRSTRDFGDYHCIDVIQAEQKNKSSNAPIFFLSSDNTAREILNTSNNQETFGDCPVNVLTFGGLILGLEKRMY
jgi:hypothetical protein